MRESRTYGFVRGALSDGRPYRDPFREERVFFALEMRARANQEPIHRRWMYEFYDCISQYGHSLVRPLLGLLILFFVFGLFYSHQASDHSEPTETWYELSLASEEPWYLSAAHTFPIPGLFGSEDEALEFVFGAGLTLWGEIIVAVQSIFSAVLIFVLLLGIRNRFRIR
jgi:hypothetical protein